MRAPIRPSQIQRAAYERLWRRAEEIRSLCGLPPLPHHEPGAPDSIDPLSLGPLVEILLQDLEGNFRRELATRVQLEGLAELMAFAAAGAEPGESYRTLVNYLARMLTARESARSAPIGPLGTPLADPSMRARTPGRASALLVLMERIRAWGWGLRRIMPCSIPGNWISAPYLAAPVTLSNPS